MDLALYLDYLTETLNEHNFEIINLSKKDYQGSDGISSKDLLILARLS